MDPIIGLVILICFDVIGFALLTFLRRWNDSFVLIAFAIGAIVNANFYSYLFTPVDTGHFVFAMDSILLIMFSYIVGEKVVHYTRKEVKVLVNSSLVAILISALIQYFAQAATFGFTWEVTQTLLALLASIFASAIGISLEIHIIHEFKAHKWNRYLGLGIAMFFFALVNSVIHQSLLLAIYQNIDANFWKSLLGSWVGKFFTIGIALICHYINLKYWIPKEILEREKEKTN